MLYAVADYGTSGINIGASWDILYKPAYSSFRIPETKNPPILPDFQRILTGSRTPILSSYTPANSTDLGRMTRFEFAIAVKQEAAYLRLVHPTPDDIPSCLLLIEVSMGCLYRYLLRSQAEASQALRFQVKSRYPHGESSRCAHKHDDFKFLA
ncbi:hypothetical protein EDD85DRAFT_909494 [Armillaria nabsnona]|nr:hypothetical protein EDD85DRAFT_909494 [Armillaria nabsnona]